MIRVVPIRKAFHMRQYDLPKRVVVQAIRQTGNEEGVVQGVAQSPGEECYENRGTFDGAVE